MTDKVTPEHINAYRRAVEFKKRKDNGEIVEQETFNGTGLEAPLAKLKAKLIELNEQANAAKERYEQGERSDRE